jgi:hypothetical protein
MAWVLINLKDSSPEVMVAKGETSNWSATSIEVKNMSVLTNTDWRHSAEKNYFTISTLLTIWVPFWFACNKETEAIRKHNMHVDTDVTASWGRTRVTEGHLLRL